MVIGRIAVAPFAGLAAAVFAVIVYLIAAAIPGFILWVIAAAVGGEKAADFIHALWWSIVPIVGIIGFFAGAYMHITEE